MCYKISYNTRELALEDAKIIRMDLRRRTERGKQRPVKRLRPYECYICGKWHLTSLKKRKY